MSDVIKRVTVDGKPGVATFTDGKFNPVSEDSATFMKIVFDDGEQLILDARKTPK